MSAAWLVSDAIVSPLGNTTEDNYARMQKSESGIRIINDPSLNNAPFYASVFKHINNEPGITRLEHIAVQATAQAIRGLALSHDRTIFIFSSTKGNIEFLEYESWHPRISLHNTAAYIAATFGFKNTIVVSNACISGVMALVVAKRYLDTERFDHAVIVGAEVLSRFIVSGFQSLFALGTAPCQPFDKNRSGISLGEAAGAIVLSNKPEKLSTSPRVQMLGAGLSNDANHISGPSRTGKELASAITHALKYSDRSPAAIDFVSAHGTATLYNDEMEAKAFALCGLSNVPTNSLKGYFGHTLGAAGIIETIIAKECLIRNELMPTQGFEQAGVSVAVNIVKTFETKQLRTILKTASGFGGCNAALVLGKNNDN